MTAGDTHQGNKVTSHLVWIQNKPDQGSWQVDVIFTYRVLGLYMSEHLTTQ